MSEFSSVEVSGSSGFSSPESMIFPSPDILVTLKPYAVIALSETSFIFTVSPGIWIVCPASSVPVAFLSSLLFLS